MTRFSRWSQRKRGLEPVDEAAPDLTPSAEESRDVSDPAAVAEGETPSQETAAELPDPDTLPSGSDLTAYLSSGVGRELRRKALKRLFAADHYHHRDGLNDYDDDYRKLKSLSQDVADRLRQWTRQLDDEEEEKPQAASHTDSPATEADATSPDAPEDAPPKGETDTTRPPAERHRDSEGQVKE
ncbi:DUF3306 domain-containing protein [Onishia taeanensis]